MDTNVPEALRKPAEAALEWLNSERTNPFELTAVVDSESALTTPLGETFELGLVLCDGELCGREQVRVTPDGDEFRFSRVESAPRTIPTLLDPPVGTRRKWLDKVMGRHEFVVLLFYRGLW